MILLIVACSKSDFDSEYASLKENPPLRDGGKHVLLDHQGVSYLRLSFNNRFDCSFSGKRHFEPSEIEMAIFSQNVLLDVEGYKGDLPHFEYIVVLMFDYETKEILNTYVKDQPAYF